MKQNLTALILAFLVTGVFAQNEMMHVPNGTSGISNTTNSRGVTIGVGFNTPEGKLHIKDELDEGTVVLLEAEQSQALDINNVLYNTEPDFFIRARRNSFLAPSFKFSVDVNGRIQSGFSNTSVNEQLAVLNNMAIYRGSNQKL